MQPTVVTMLMILAGLGGYNKQDDGNKPAPGNTEPALTADVQQLAPLGPAEAAAAGEPQPTPPSAKADTHAGTGIAPDGQPIAPAIYAPYGLGPAGADEGLGYSIGEIVHRTLYSFCCGRDPDVLTAKQIEAGFYSGAYSGFNDYYPSAVLNPDGPR